MAASKLQIHSVENSWRLSELSATEQADLRSRFADAERGQSVLDFDEAMVIARELRERVLNAPSSASSKSIPA